MQTKLLDLQLMSDEEINWLNDYHAEVWNKVRCMSSLVPQQILLFELYCEKAIVTESLHSSGMQQKLRTQFFCDGLPKILGGSHIIHISTPSIQC